jgi:uncharacterized pyridoxal phosphate-containing UPF0001 family protein
MSDDDNTSLTTAKTLWTETILEILYQSLKANKPDAVIRDVLKEVRQKGFKPDEIVQKVEKYVDRQASLRVRGLMQKAEL